MIKDVKEAAEMTADWILRQAQRSHAGALVVGISGGVDSAVVAGLCRLTNLAPIVGVIMPCHSSPSSVARGHEVIKAFGLKEISVDLVDAFESISGQVRSFTDVDTEDQKSMGALRSCLRAPTLDFVAKISGGIIVGTGNRDEDEVTRYFQKRGDGCVDISPIAKFHKSEIYQLAKHLGVPDSVITATPSADLWGPDSGQEDEKELGITYAEIEWAMQFAQKYSQIPLSVTGGVSAVHFDDALDMAKKLKLEVTQHQREIIGQLSYMEEASRHKANPNLPVFDAREVLGLDRELVA